MASTSANYSLLQAIRNYLGLKETQSVAAFAEVTCLSDSNGGSREACVLVVVRDVETVGSLLVLERKASSQLSVLNSYPITADLAITVSQFKSGGSDVRQVQTLKTSQFLLSIEYEGARSGFLAEASSISDLLAQYKRLKAESASSDDAPLHEANAEYYSAHQIPTDLRIANQPLIAHLSPAVAGDPGDEESDAQIIRDDWIRQAMRSRENEYAKKHSVSIRLCSFNVNGQPPKQDLSPWIRPQRSSIDSSTSTFHSNSNPKPDPEDPDLLVIGFQEVDLSSEAHIRYTPNKENEWLQAIFAALGEAQGKYMKVASQQLVGMLVIVIARITIVKDISQVRACSVANGVLGMLGNKGATAIRLNLFSTSLTFVNAHLAAGDEMISKRNSDYHDLCNRMVFAGTSTEDSVVGVFETDVLFWMGDLNYRIDLPDPEVRGLLACRREMKEGNYRELKTYDQLTIAIRNFLAFEGFKEADFEYPPTYRFAQGEGKDELGYDLKRCPAWTDRILHMSSRTDQFHHIASLAHPGVKFSDHVPISASYTVNALEVDDRAYHNTLVNVLKQIRSFTRPGEHIIVNKSVRMIEMGGVKYNEERVYNVVLHNTSEAVSYFRVVPTMSDYPLLPSWLKVEPLAGLILPGGKTDVKLNVHVDRDSAYVLNTSAEMDHILIIHIGNSQDHFISIQGIFQKTCFANTLRTLSSLTGPIRTSKRLSTVESTRLSEDGKAMAAAVMPKEVSRLLKWLMSHDGPAVDTLFEKKGDQVLVDQIRECLDTGVEFPFSTSDAEAFLAVGETMIQLLDSLQHPIVPPALHESCALISNRDDALELVMQLPDSAANIWISLTAFLHFVLQRDGARKKERVETISGIFAPILLKSGDTNGAGTLTPLAKRRFVSLFIT